LVLPYLVTYLRDHTGQLRYVLLAELSLLITVIIVFQNPSSYSFQEQKTVSSIIFGGICLLGIIAGTSPRCCYFKHMSERRDHDGDGVAGHHPSCGKFTGHTLSLGSRVFCAGCSGLVLGAFIALICLVSGFYPLSVVTGFWLGTLLTGLGLAQHLIDLGSEWIHFILNIAFVSGAWFMFGAIQVMDLSFFVSAYFLAVTVFWIYARISVSQLTHVGVCRDCDRVCEYRFS
jgi:hypothetical protein